MLQELKVFIASPNDVIEERDTVEAVLKSINMGMAADRNLIFSTYRWENEYPRAGDPQFTFTKKISECSLFIAIFWRRIGTLENKESPSTVQEVQEALRLYKNNGVPDVMIYFSNRSFESEDPKDYVQKVHVLELQKRLENDPLWKTLYKKYSEKNNFEMALRQDIERWLRDKYPITKLIRASTSKRSDKTKIIMNDPVLIWSKCLSIIKDQVTLMTYNTWFAPIKPIEMFSSTLKLKLPSKFFWEWIDEHYNTLITKTVHDVIGPETKLAYVVLNEKDVEDLYAPVNNSPSNQPVITETTKPKQDFESFLNPRYTFDNFIKGEGNQLARAAAGAISDNPAGTSFNPMFIYGGVGLGKTHLIQAIGNKILQNMPEKRVIYLSADMFTVEFVEAIQNNTINEFSNFYGNMDVLIIDDVQFFIGKEKTQDLFFQIFNFLHQSKKQIILACDKPPKDLMGFDHRLISRFQLGLTTDIEPPDLETRIAILKRKAEDYGMYVSAEIIEYIANNITSNIRELEGFLIKLLAYSSLNSRDITLSSAKEIMSEEIRYLNSVTIESITRIVCNYFKIDENKIWDKTRRIEVVLARQIAMYLSKELTKSSLKTIGLHFGGIGRSTVLHAHKLIEAEISIDPKLREVLCYLRNEIELNCLSS
jgi:chromosomal replication initiator protein